MTIHNMHWRGLAHEAGLAYELDDGPLTAKHVAALREDVKKHAPRGKRINSLALFKTQILHSQSEASKGLVVPYKFGSVGREFGSPDYERLNAEDAKQFAFDLQVWIIDSNKYIGSDNVTHAVKEFETEANNIQMALHQLGKDVSIEVAAAVWINYSKSLCAGWMEGAGTVESAARTLYLNCPHNQHWFETAEESSKWFRTPHPMLERETPLDAGKTALGAQNVLSLLCSIKYGGLV
jgi:hypothetical protein